MNNNIYTDLELLPEDLQGWNGTSSLFSDLILKIKPSLIVSRYMERTVSHQYGEGG